MLSGAVSINIFQINEMFWRYSVGEYVELNGASDSCFNLKCLFLKYQCFIAHSFFFKWVKREKFNAFLTVNVRWMLKITAEYWYILSKAINSDFHRPHYLIHIYVYSGFGGLVVSMLASGTQDRGFDPGRSRRIFLAKKIHSMPSLGGK